MQEFQNGKTTHLSWQDAVLLVARERRWKLYEELKTCGRPVIAVVDARYDSTRNGYHGSVVFMDHICNKVLHVETLTRKDTGSSWAIEDIGFEDGIDELEQVMGLNIGEVIHDDKASVDSKMRKMPKQKINSKDMWHCTKNKIRIFNEEMVTKKRQKTTTVTEACTKAHLQDLTLEKLRTWMKGQTDIEPATYKSLKKSDLVQAIWDKLVALGLRSGDGDLQVSVQSIDLFVTVHRSQYTAKHLQLSRPQYTYNMLLETAGV